MEWLPLNQKLHDENKCATQLQNFDGLLQKRQNSSALAAELSLFCIKPFKWYYEFPQSIV